MSETSASDLAILRLVVRMVVSINSVVFVIVRNAIGYGLASKLVL
jgi:hypothetical protein